MINSHTEVILALDVENRSKAESILEKTGEQLRWVKIGLQTYLRDGPEFLRDVASMGKFIFLDLKLHDIPNTMAKAMESLAQLPIKMLTIHATAGPEALRKCVLTAKDILPEVQLRGGALGRPRRRRRHLRLRRDRLPRGAARRRRARQVRRPRRGDRDDGRGLRLDARQAGGAARVRRDGPPGAARPQRDAAGGQGVQRGEPTLRWLDFFDKLLTDDGERLADGLALDGTHMHPAYVNVLEEALERAD